MISLREGGGSESGEGGWKGWREEGARFWGVGVRGMSEGGREGKYLESCIRAFYCKKVHTSEIFNMVQC